MNDKKTNEPDRVKVSIDKIPIRRAWLKAKKSTLLVILIAGFGGGMIYNKFFKNQNDEPVPGTIQVQVAPGQEYTGEVQSNNNAINEIPNISLE